MQLWDGKWPGLVDQVMAQKRFDLQPYKRRQVAKIHLNNTHGSQDNPQKLYI